MTGWKTVALGDVAEIAAGGGAPQDTNDFSEDGYPFVRAGSLKGLLAGNSPNQLECLTPTIAAKHKLRLFPSDTVLFAKSGMSASIGLVYRLKWPAYVVNHLAAVVCQSKLDSSFLHQYLRAFPPSRLIQDEAYPSIRLGDIAALKVPLPHIDEQRRIAAILDHADTLRAKRREALAKLDSLTQSIFDELFGDPSSNPKSWSIHLLGAITEKITDGEHLNPEFSLTGMPIVMAGNVLEASIEFAETKFVEISLGERFRKKCNPERGDLLIVSRGATIGRMCAVDTDNVFCLMGSVILMKIKKEKLNTAFVSGLLKHQVMRSALYKTSGSSAQQAIYLKDLKNLPVILPPIQLQHQFAEHVAAIEQLKLAHRKSLSELDALFASLQHRAFRGEL